MRYINLGKSGLKVSSYCLGSMTWGQQTSEKDAWKQLDSSLDSGINFFDTAEMYPTIPTSKKTQGNTERIIGRWIKSSKRRNDIIIATKVSGEGYMNVRKGDPITKKTILQAVESSLKSLQTEFIDLYQLHWPNRGSYNFRKNWYFDPTDQNTEDFYGHIDEVLETFQSLIKQGKIRHIGLSNESAWGTLKWLHKAENNNLPKMISIQNEYSLLCRMFDLDLAELCHHEDMHLLSYSPLATGLLTGKYQNNNIPKKSRKETTSELGGRITKRVFKAVDAYLNIAKKYNIDPVHLALSWTEQRKFMGSVIFGATTQIQLNHIIKGLEVKLSKNILKEIDEVNKLYPMPF